MERLNSTPIEETKNISEVKIKIPDEVQEEMILFFMQTSIPRKKSKQEQIKEEKKKERS